MGGPWTAAEGLDTGALAGRSWTRGRGKCKG